MQLPRWFGKVVPSFRKSDLQEKSQHTNPGVETPTNSRQLSAYRAGDAAALDRLKSLHRADRQREQLARSRTVEKWEGALPKVPTHIPSPEQAREAIRVEQLKKEFPEVPTHLPDLLPSKKKHTTQQIHARNDLVLNRTPSKAALQKLVDQKKAAIITLKESIAASRLDPDLFGAARERKAMRDSLNVETAKVAMLEKMLRGRP